MNRTVSTKHASPAVLESRAVKQQGVQRMAQDTGGGAAQAAGCVAGSVVQNKIPPAEAARHAAMGGGVAARRRAMAAVGSQGAVDADGDYDGDVAVR